jgi:glycine/D-amino acid oxidase-like deaminating enzyme
MMKPPGIKIPLAKPPRGSLCSSPRARAIGEGRALAASNIAEGVRVNRRKFLEAGSAAALSVALGGCAPLFTSGRPRKARVNLTPVDVSWDRIIRTTVGLRPFRESGFVVRLDRLDDRTLVHNYGHGGAGMSTSWGTASLAADLAMSHPDRRAAVIGCGVVGLTTARTLQRRGFDVSIYAAALPPDTTSNMSFASFTPTSGLVSSSHRTPQWDEQFRRAVEIAYRQLQLLVGPRYGVSWIDDYAPTNSVGAGTGPPTDGLLPPGLDLARVRLEEGEHPFGTRYARRHPTLRFEPSIYLDALMRDVLTFGGHITVRSFETPRDLMSLSETLIFNCTGLGAKGLFGDDELTPVKGQLVVLVPQADVTYSTGTMLPRSDGIVLGHVMQPGVASLDVDDAERRRVIEFHLRLFGAMRQPDRRLALTSGASPAAPPPVESFFGRES